MPLITVVIGDRKKSGRAACLSVLKREKWIQVVAETRSGLEVITAAARLKPRILLFNSNLFKEKRDNLLRALRQESPRSKVILLTRRVSEKTILEALSHGARGYLKESAMSTFLPKAVRLVDAGEAWVPRKMVAKIIECLAHLTGPGEDSDTGLKHIGPKSN
jgi:DNA-binding NarL/FixJ family response regulator